MSLVLGAIFALFVVLHGGYECVWWTLTLVGMLVGLSWIVIHEFERKP